MLRYWVSKSEEGRIVYSLEFSALALQYGIFMRTYTVEDLWITEHMGA